MTVIMMEVDKPAVVKEIDGSLRGMQKIVEGSIELYCPFEEDVGIILNEEGKILELEANRIVFRNGRPIDILCGPIFIVGLDSASGEFTSLTKGQLTRIMPRLEVDKRFIIC